MRVTMRGFYFRRNRRRKGTIIFRDLNAVCQKSPIGNCELAFLWIVYIRFLGPVPKINHKSRFIIGNTNSK